VSTQASQTHSSPQAVLSLRQLRLSLAQAGQQFELIKGIDLDLHAGEVVGLVGESGCGKSLTGNALLGMLPSPQARMQCQEFLLNGEQDLAKADEKRWRQLRGRHLAMIFQEPHAALDPVFTIGQQMQRVIRRHMSVNRRRSGDLAAASLADCGLADGQRILNAYPHQLSGGMRQRVMIAMALSCKPEVLIADEPTSALDITSRDQILALLRHAAVHHGSAVLLISHDLAAVARICDRVLVMYAGRMLESGPAATVLSQPSHPYTAALLQATPRISTRTSSRQPPTVKPIPGRLQALHLPASGCAFTARCQRATELCQQLPELQPDDRHQHRFACHHPLAGIAS